MRIAIFGLGKMGANMARRLCRSGIEVVAYNRTFEKTRQLAQSDGVLAAETVDAAIAELPSPRIIWLMLPAGETTENMLQTLADKCQKDDIIIDGGNANYHDSERRGAWLAQKGVRFADAGTSGGIWGLDNGYCLMVGAQTSTIEAITPVLKALAPAPDTGWAHVGPVGAGHFVKMVHNGIEYGMMQAYAEGFALLRGKQSFDLDLAQISEIWRHGSVVRSWLLDLSTEALQKDQDLHDIAPIVPDSGEGRWTVVEAIDQGQSLPVISMALHMRFSSQDKQGYGHRVLAMMRNAFGGHAVHKK